MRTPIESGRALLQARERMDSLFRLVRPGSLYKRPIAERHRIIFYLGHVDAFDWNLLARYELGMPAFHEEFDRLFAFGIDPPPGQLPDDQPTDWPGLAEVRHYQERTRAKLDDLIAEFPEELVNVAIEHRLMHAETFAYILHQLEYSNKIAPDQGRPPARRQRTGSTVDEMVAIPAGQAWLGLERNGGFGWDNEFEACTVDVPGFAVGKYKVTNGDYLEFVEQGAETPFFWVRREDGWALRGMFSEYPLPLDAPVYVTHDQATAYANWRGMRLPGEDEYHRAACGAARSSNLNFRYWDPIPVTADDDGSHRPMQLPGNGWEWTSTLFAPFPGFEPFPFYRNYSEPFFDGQHYVLKGGSPLTAECFLRPSFRNWFRPSYPYIYATFRLVAG
ncbi:MAG: SUMF1/EgtB/PvdO family nonheme iron enzyme [Candidatus Solibacter sp.]